MAEQEQRLCRRCGIPLTDPGKTQTYCPDCRDIRRREADYRMKAKTAGTRLLAMPLREHPAPPPAVSLDEMARRAAAAGVSYGRYVAKVDGRKERESR